MYVMYIGLDSNSPNTACCCSSNCHFVAGQQFVGGNQLATRRFGRRQLLLMPTDRRCCGRGRRRLLVDRHRRRCHCGRHRCHRRWHRSDGGGRCNSHCRFVRKNDGGYGGEAFAFGKQLLPGEWLLVRVRVRLSVGLYNIFHIRESYLAGLMIRP